MWQRHLWARFVDALAASLVPFGVVVNPRPVRDASWWPV
jgi:hypothetical protein